MISFPSSNRFTMAFYQHCLRVDESDVMAVFVEFDRYREF